jgi:hypothetical protein
MTAHEVWLDCECDVCRQLAAVAQSETLFAKLYDETAKRCPYYAAAHPGEHLDDDRQLMIEGT